MPDTLAALLLKMADQHHSGAMGQSKKVAALNGPLHGDHTPPVIPKGVKDTSQKTSQKNPKKR